ncbi:TPR-like protein [Basidiobolus meristosporus CBS 931.73]|uniref:TPR-like protein n=1 Tax=Basidiobolus meristosporus CBS 931.73 TaxID=1314790 RepID=A0A1Y1Y8V9_9FUNG|nr:TPR-like protein [Basidiobolus meristosporus CBS 931.73]|eukprot:ORX94315.1 TPR-like protein [Basidiobolus meristosporus CBS 931.73]
MSFLRLTPRHLLRTRFASINIHSRLYTQVRDTNIAVKAVNSSVPSNVDEVPISEEELSEVYESLNQPLPKPRSVATKISPKFLDELGVTYLDTRSLNDTEAEEAITLKNESSVLELNLKRFNQVIYANALAKRPKEAEEAFALLKESNIQPDVRTFNHLMDAYANVNQLEKVVKTFKLMEEFNIEPSIHSYGTLIKAYTRSNRVYDAFKVYDAMKLKNIVPSQPIFTTLISGCIKDKNLTRAWRTFDHMRLEICRPDEVSYSLMIHACAQNQEVERALNLFDEMAAAGLYPTDVTFNSLINACAKREDYYNEGFELLEQMQEQGFKPDIYTFNSLIFACSKKNDLSRARLLFRDMIKSGDDFLKPNEITYTNLMWVYASYKPPNRPSGYKALNGSEVEGKQSLEVVEDTYPLLSHEPTNKTEFLQEVDNIFNYAVETASHRKESVSLRLVNSYLALFVNKREVDRAIDVYNNLLPKLDLEPNGWTYKSMLQLCDRERRLDTGKEVWERMSKWSRSLEETSTKRGREREMERVFQGRNPPEEYACYRYMISAYARCNDVDSALELLNELAHNSITGHRHRPRLPDFQLLYTRCVELEDNVSKVKLIELCPNGKDNVSRTKDELRKKWAGMKKPWDISDKKRHQLVGAYKGKFE